MLSSCVNNSDDGCFEEPVRTENEKEHLITLSLMSNSKPAKLLDVSYWVDSGYLTKNTLSSWLLSFELCDSNKVSWSAYHQNDTIAKYYRTDNNSFYLCYQNLIYNGDCEIHFIDEISLNGELLKHYPFTHGNVACCWERFNGFWKLGDYYLFKHCGSGSSYCSGSYEIFKLLTPEDSLSSITESVYSGMMGDDLLENSIILYAESKMSILKNQITMIYTHELESGAYENDPILIRKGKMKLVYTEQNGKWIESDTVVLYRSKGFDLY